MGAGVLAAALFSSFVAQVPDTNPYSSAATRELVARAMERHRAQDASVRDYQARLRYRLTAALGRRRWGNAPPVAVEEQDARVAWQEPNDLRVEIVGQRSRTRESGGELFSGFDSPWFVPRGLGDSVRIFGSDFPERAALHPLASDGPDWYRYAAGDTVTLTLGGGRQLRLTEIEVVPRRPGPALIVGKLWLDLEQADVVRLAFRYVGSELWDTPDQATSRDSAEARRTNRLVNRFLSVEGDLEYALQDGRYWMPYRQVLSGRVQIPLVSDLYVPFEAATTFSEYEINTGRPIAFRLPPPDTLRRLDPEARAARRDSLRAERRGRGVDSTRVRERAGILPGGGRFEIWRASRDSLRRYTDWEEPLRFRRTEADDRRLRETRHEIADLVEGLSRDITGIRRTGFSYERLADVFRFNRVQGTSIGAGYQVDLRALSYTSLFATGRIGFSDWHPTARLALVRDAPGGRLTAAIYHDLGEGDPWGQGLSGANSIRGLIAARDEGEYHRASGASLRLEAGFSGAVELLLGARLERQRNAEGGARAWLNDWFGGDGLLPPNPAIQTGDFLVGAAGLQGRVGRARWDFRADLIGTTRFDHGTLRGYGEWRQAFGGRSGATLRVRAGAATRPVPPQFLFRAGGQGSVRGFDYGFQRGDAVWSVQLDVSPSRRTLRPVLFLDAGRAGLLEDLTRGPVLVGGGAGLSLLNGLIRLDLSHPITPRPPDSGLRFDVVFGGRR